jgi:hypothetical protein
MESLPIVPASCSLDEHGLTEQLERYLVAGAGASVLVRDPRRITIRVGDAADEAVIDELIAVERACCPFYALEWEPANRQLTIAVSAPEHEPALDAIAHALRLPPAPELTAAAGESGSSRTAPG